MCKLKSNIRQNCFCIDYNKEYVVNPYNGNVLCSVKHFELRKRACDKLFERTGLFNFKFVNQSFATISKMIFWLANGCEYKTSSYNNAVMKALEYFPRPFNRTLRVVEENERGFRCGMDRACAYTTLILEHFKSKRIPVITIYDDIKEFEGEFVGEEGMYLISKFYVKNVPFDTMLVSHNIIKMLIDRGIVVKITHFIKTHDYNEGDLLVNFVRKTESLLYTEDWLDRDLFKSIINTHTGTYNKQFKHTGGSFITNSYETQCLAAEAGMTLEPFSYTEDGVRKQMVICKDNRSERLDADNCLIYAEIIGCGIVGFIDTVLGLPENYEVVGGNTDAAYYLSPVKECDLEPDRTSIDTIILQPFKRSFKEFKNKKRINKEFKKPFDITPREWNTVTTLDSFTRIGLDQPGGYGKTYTILSYCILNNLKFLFVSHQNSVVRDKKKESDKIADENGIEHQRNIL